MKRKLTFKMKIIFSVLLITFVPLFLSYLIFFHNKISSDKMSIQRNLLETSKFLSADPTIIKSLIIKDFQSGVIERKADEFVNNFSDVDIVVVTDLDGIKYSHLDKPQIGTPFQNPIEWEKIKKGEGYFSQMKGSMGITFRWFEPLYTFDKERVIGFVMVGKYYNVISTMKKNLFLTLITLFSLSILTALLLAIKFSTSIKKELLGLEPEEIKKLYIEETLIIDNLESGVIALNKRNEITKLNRVFLNKFKNLDASHIVEYIRSKNNFSNPNITSYDMIIDGEYYIVKILPIYNLNTYLGSTLLIRTRDSISQQAKDITGIDSLIDGVRANIHEFKNKLHIILGLINLNKIDDAKRYILKSQELNELDFQKFLDIKNPLLKAMFIGKNAVCGERGIDFIFNFHSISELVLNDFFIEDLTTIIGNLIDNSIDSFVQFSVKNPFIQINLINYEGVLEIDVMDNGREISEDNLLKIYNQGFSTKGENRGLGLSIIKEKIDLYNGSIKFTQNKEYKHFKIKLEKK